MVDEGKGEEPRPSLWSRMFVPANLVMGLPAIVPLHSARWLVTEYAPMDCQSVGETFEPGYTGSCDYHVLDHAPVIWFLLLLSLAFVLFLVLLVDVLLPRWCGWPLRRWSLAALLVPVPYGLLLSLDGLG